MALPRQDEAATVITRFRQTPAERERLERLAEALHADLSTAIRWAVEITHTTTIGADMDTDLLSDLFTYHQPNPETALAHTAVDDAYYAVVAIIDCYADVAPVRDDSVHSAVRNVMFRFAETILRVCPLSADRTAAVRCVRLACNAVITHLHDAEHSTQRTMVIAYAELLKARWQANASIALNGRG